MIPIASLGADRQVSVQSLVAGRVDWLSRQEGVDGPGDVRAVVEFLRLPLVVAALVDVDAEVTQALEPHREVHRLVVLLVELVFVAVVAGSNVVRGVEHQQRRVAVGNLHSVQLQLLQTAVDINQPPVVAADIPSLVEAIQRRRLRLALLRAVIDVAVVAVPDGRLILAAAEAAEKLLRLATVVVVAAVNAVDGDRRVVAGLAAVAGDVLAAAAAAAAAVVVAVIGLEEAVTFSVLLDLPNDP